MDLEVVEDGNLITSRKPDDLKSFCAALLRQVDQGIAPRLEPPLAPEAPEAQPPAMH